MPATTTAQAAPTIAADLSLTRLHLMRAGYLLMVAGLALKKCHSFQTRTRCRSTKV